MHRYLLISAFCLLFALPGQAQQEETTYKNAFTVKLFGLSVHLKESPHPEIFPNRIDDKGFVTLNYGAIVGYDRFIVENKHAIRAEQGLYADCSASLAGFTHIGWRGLIFQKNRHSMNGGIGPTLVYRHNWNRLEGYKDDGYFKQRGDWQYKFYWYAGELEYNYQLTAQTDFSVTMVPGLPELISFGVGVRQRF
ncbi:hypothetical protein [Pontibacter burrus]|uniref:DUF3575 domain-containing protein n=1 Tax=Pontibacter burrus TaxID=2704466 RepID=A0A6B3LL03_9BACT|nr:hypothetical protein [Pontibacter burrus]NEM96643.1 hypothetical protein [Pontibacter burrus]